ncbi:MAG TPA: hypothetical protein VFU26_13870 [Gaiellaceae bacterium]|nr:hypothetical protein [Gaiellaceae bacterium]
MNILASKFRQREIETGLMRQVARAVLEAGAEAPKANPRARPLDHRALRGIPAVGRFSGGSAIPGSRPDRDAPSLCV